MRKHLSFANVLSCLALFLALGGAAYAAALGKNAVKTANIAKGAVTTPKLKNGAVASGKLANGSVLSAKLANGAVGSGKIASSSVTAGKIADGTVIESKLASNAVTASKLASNSVNSAKLANNAVTASKLAGESVATGKIAKASITSTQLSSGLLAQLVHNVSYVTETSVSDPTDAKSATASCAANMQVIGGGARVLGANTKVVLSESAPFVTPDNKLRTGWVAAAREVEEETSNWAVVAYAICAEL